MECREIRVIIGRNIRRHRRRSGRSLEMVARLMDTTPEALRRVENGNRSITCDDLITLAAFFGCSVDELCRGGSARKRTRRRGGRSARGQPGSAPRRRSESRRA